MVVPVYGIHGSANAKSVATLRWTAVEETPITAESVKTQDFLDVHNPRLHLALALCCAKEAPW